MKVKTILGIVSASFLFATLIFSTYRAVRHWRIKRLLNPVYTIDTIVQTGPVKEALPTVLLAEFLDLSSDQPTNFFSFDEKRAVQKLLNVPVIAKARIEKRKPNIVYVDYTLRRPIALFADFTNMAIDEEKHLFPLAPYFSPKELPEIVLGEHRFSEIVTGEKIDLAFRILSLLQKASFGTHAMIRRIDVSKAYAKSYGKREIILIIDHQKERHYLRTTEKVLPSALANYASLVQDMIPEEAARVIDLRIEKLAYVEDLP